MRSLIRPLAMIVMALAAGDAFADSLVHPSQPACLAQVAGGVPRSRLSVLARGFNLTGWLEVPPRRPDMTVLAQLHARGFSHVRLPVEVETLSEEFSTPEDAERQLGALDAALDALSGLGFAVSIDMHPGGRFGRLHLAQPEQALGILRSVWHRLARRYAGRSPERVFFEVLNEPAVDAGIWKEQGPRLVAAIRSEAPDHTIIYDHADYQRIDALPAVTPVADANVVYAAHFYDPMIFTHQGLDWSETPLRYLHQVPFPARLGDPAVASLLDELKDQGRSDSAAMLTEELRKPWTEERIDAEILRAASWAELHQRPVIINEFGVLGWKADPADRARWLSAVRGAAERHCLGWAHWDYADAFGFVRRVAGREIPDQTIMRALLGPRGKSPTIP